MDQYVSRQSDRVNLPDTSMKSLVSADPDIFPNFRILLELGCTLFATSADAERSFLVLRLIKRNLRCWMADTRFSAVTLMKLHHCKHIDSNHKWSVCLLNSLMTHCTICHIMTGDTFMFLVTNRVSPNNPIYLYIH